MFAFFLAALPIISASAIPLEPKIHEVTLGGAAPNQISFVPNTVSAEPGDVIRFVFKQKNHTVTQTSFEDVCQPLINESTHNPVFDTGFMPVADEKQDNFPFIDLPVLHKDPSWFYCRQTRHCGQGMIFAINAPKEGEKTFENYEKKALEFGKREGEPPAQSSAASTATQSYTWTETAAYSGTAPPAAYPTESTGAQHLILVGADGSLTYDPPFVAAKPQDTIVFEFRAKNHTVTQSSFEDPCRKLEFTSTEKGFDSGFTPVTNGTVSFPTFNVTVKDNEPIWVYCRQDKHCGQGMVFAINPPSENDFTDFVARAKAINGTTTNGTTSSSLVQPTSNNFSNVAIPTVRASTTSAILVVGGLFILAL